MKQLLIRQGAAVTRELPAPALDEGMLLVHTRASCISPGTEMMGLASSGKSLLRRALEQPDKVKAALTQMRREGVRRVLSRAQDKVAEAKPSGYSAAGVVLALGQGVSGFQVGDAIALAGATYAYHAEQVVVPVNLAARMPEGLSFEEASTVALGAIALQGVRRAGATLGECTAVMGCGALGLLTIQLLRAAGCRVVATDPDPNRLALAERLGAELVANPKETDPVQRFTQFSGGTGIDAVIITAATTSNEPLLQAFRMCRRKGRVVLVGVVGREFSRDEMYAKELDLLISTSYGPGRYDDTYERWGLDYPFAYVRWTENRNMQAYLQLVAQRQIRLEDLLGPKFPIERCEEAYGILRSESPPLLVTFTYPEQSQPSPAPRSSDSERLPERTLVRPTPIQQAGPLGLAIIGAGSFVRQMHLPNLRQLGDEFAVRWIIDVNGLAADAATSAAPGSRPGTDIDAALQDPTVHAVIIGTRHYTHADLSLQALRAGKAVFVEKPMCLTREEFTELSSVLDKGQQTFLVGYNRRFAPHAEALHRHLRRRINPAILRYTMNAGHIPYDHWTQTAEGGGRIMGEACHILDLFRFLVGHPAVSLSVDALSPATDAVRPDDNCIITVKYADGSVASLLYTSIGHAGVPKERMEVFFDESALVLEDYQVLQGHGIPGGDLRLPRQDKGHLAEMRAFGAALRQGNPFVIPLEELKETWWLTLQASELCRHR